MTILNYSLGWYVDRLKAGERFSLAHFGDGEWMAATKERLGSQNAEGTAYTEKLCDELVSVLRYKANDFFIATPDDLKHLGMQEPIGRWMAENGIDIEFLEKEVWNSAQRAGELGPFIHAVRAYRPCIISNEAMRGLYFLDYGSFVEIGYPNAYEDIDRIVEQACEAAASVYIVAAGLAGPCIVKRLHERLGANTAFIIEVGSIFDGFVGMGGQRGSRAEMYADPRKVMAWRANNLKGAYGDDGK